MFSSNDDDDDNDDNASKESANECSDDLFDRLRKGEINDAKDRTEATPTVMTVYATGTPNYSPAAQPMMISTMAAAPAMQDVAVDYDEEAWSDSGDSHTAYDTHTKTKPDGSVVETTIATTKHRDGLRSSVKTVRMSKALEGGIVKQKTTVTTTNKQGTATKQTKMEFLDNDETEALNDMTMNV